MARHTASREDEKHLRRCLALARRAAGRTRPNPMVGAVLVKSGRVLAEAWHRRAGAPHAEAAALGRAGGAARGATLYVNLEPCRHYGRTPPCVDAILAAGVRRVVASHADPFPRVRGRGFAALRRAGVEVVVGPLEREARIVNETYLTWVTRGRPLVTVKAAMSLDGRIAASSGESRWISSAASRALAHRMRAGSDAVMVGIGTALADDPLLTARTGAPSSQPFRVVVDGRLRLPPAARMLRSTRAGAGGPVLIYGARGAPRSRRERLEAAGAVVVTAPGSARRVDLEWVLKDLASRGVTSLLLEGGGELIGEALDSGLVDRVRLFIAPILIGGRGAAPVAGGRGARRLREAAALSNLKVRRVGPDLLVEGRVSGRRGRDVHRDRH